jgi:hypothetical protein
MTNLSVGPYYVRFSQELTQTRMNIHLNECDLGPFNSIDDKETLTFIKTVARLQAVPYVDFYKPTVVNRDLMIMRRIVVLSEEDERTFNNISIQKLRIEGSSYHISRWWDAASKLFLEVHDLYFDQQILPLMSDDAKPNILSYYMQADLIDRQNLNGPPMVHIEIRCQQPVFTLDIEMEPGAIHLIGNTDPIKELIDHRSVFDSFEITYELPDHVDHQDIAERILRLAYPHGKFIRKS